MIKVTLSVLLASLFIQGCTIAPSTIVKTPTTARPTDGAPQSTPGAIYSASTYRPLFEDRKPRLVGDIVTILITENTTARKDNSSSGSKNGSVDASITAFRGKPLPNAAFGAESELSYEDDAAEALSNRFNGSITATVTEVLPNGNLVVSGEKQISFDKGTEYVRFSGVVNPDNVTIGNNVPSNKVADARIEYRTGSKIDAAQVAGAIARFFLSMSPL